ncbi:hypothetical protein [Cytobacillus firmus]|uniref:Uncharacterized protein n=1 Tax=Cytobacillus firmus DS1 TaxID=1307436 RepID=W7LCA2_CYTFI|nr:hypothetical protein [Cytobacillus firmus]EWG12827.1 hypothetical protein PBF_00340 [Cytobacillus firmus DS1]
MGNSKINLEEVNTEILEDTDHLKMLDDTEGSVQKMKSNKKVLAVLLTVTFSGIMAACADAEYILKE